MRTELITTQFQYQKFARYLLLFVLVSSFFVPGWIYSSQDNITGYTDIVFYKNVETLWKMVILFLVSTAFLACCHSRMPWSIMGPFIPFLVWLIVSSVYNGLCLRMMRSFGSLLTPILFAAAFGTLFRFPQDIYLVKRACLWSIFIGFVYGLAFRILGVTVVDPTPVENLFESYISVHNVEIICACSITAGAISAVELKKIYSKKKMILLSFLFLIPILSAGRIFLIGSIFAYGWLFLKIFRRNAIKHLAFLIPILILGSLLMGRFYFEKTFGDSSPKISEIRSSGRWEAWPEYWEYAMKEPFFGHGPGADVAYAREYRPGQAMGCTHSDYLGLLTYGGWPALLFFLLAMFWLFAIVYKVSTKDRKYSDWYFASLMPIIFFLIAATFSNPLRELSIMCVLLAPVSMAIGHLYRQKVMLKYISQTTSWRVS